MNAKTILNPVFGIAVEVLYILLIAAAAFLVGFGLAIKF